MFTTMHTIQTMQYSYTQAPAEQTAQTDALVRYVWHMKPTDSIHDRFFDVMSFCATSHGQIVGYVGVARWMLRLWQGDFRACGLTCVCTHPKFRGKGIGTRLVDEATRWIQIEKLFDVGLFTCLPQYTPFYERGGWPHDPTLCLRDNAQSSQFNSIAMGLHTHKALLSPKAEKHATCFTKRVLTLNFPLGQFI